MALQEKSKGVKRRIREKLTQQSRIAFLDDIRTARTQAQKNAEDFSGLLVAFERLGRFLGIADDGQDADSKHGLGHFRSELRELARHSSLGAYPLEDGNADWHSNYDVLFASVTDGRNGVAHEGAKARSLTEHSIQLALVYEEALALMDDPLKTAGDLMVRSPVVAKLWQPVSFARQSMLTNSFTYLPIFVENTWKLISDAFIARYLYGAATKSERTTRMATSIENALGQFPAMPLPLAPQLSPTDFISDLLRLFDDSSLPIGIQRGASPLVVVVDKNRAREDSLMGVITAFDVL